MRFKNSIYLLFISISVNAQYNHCRNPNFEETFGAISCADPCPTNHYSDMITYWNEFWPWTLPLKTGMLNIGSPDHPLLSGPVGPHYGTCQVKEYIVQELNKQLELVKTEVEQLKKK